MKLLLGPHNDDESLFCAFTIMKEKPLVCVVFDSYVQVERGNVGATAERRRGESIDAMGELGIARPYFLGLRDDKPDYDALRSWLREHVRYKNFVVNKHTITGIICPAWEQDGHEQHNGVARVCRDLWPTEQRTEYLTYTRTFGKSRAKDSNRGGPHDRAIEVIPTPDMIARKHRALACYKSQMEVENCRDWFLGDLREYVLPPAESGVKP